MVSTQEVNQLKRNKIPFPKESTSSVSYDQKDIETLIPHRFPFLFLDQITRINLKTQSIEGKKEIALKDPIFFGHFPEKPIYPGVLQIEMMAQLGLCLFHFIQNNSLTLPKIISPLTGLFTKVNHASFLKPVLPGDTITILTQVLEYDDWIGSIQGQIFKDDELCSFSILGVYFEE